MLRIIRKLFFLVLAFVVFIFNNCYSQSNNPLLNSGEILQNGSKLHDDMKYKEAIAEYQKIDRSDTNYVNALYELSFSCYSDSQFEKSIEYAKLGMKLFPQRYATFSMQAANSLDELNREEEALQLYREGLAKNPQSYILHFNEGIVNYKLKKYDEVKKCMQRCLLINPYYASAHYYLGRVNMLQGNLVAALLAYQTYLMIAPSGKYYINVVNALSSISKADDEVMEYVKNAVRSKEDNFSEQQEILLSKLALDTKYKLKADLEDNIVRQIQVVDEKLEYNKNDKGFCMQFYAPLFIKIMKDDDFEAMIFLIFSGLKNEKIDNWNKKNKKAKDVFIDNATAYLNQVKTTQVLDFTQRENTEVNYIHNGQVVLGKGKLTKDKDPLPVGYWEYYYNDGVLKAAGTLNNSGNKEGPWTYYYANGEIKEKSNWKDGDADGFSEGWFDNGIKSFTETYRKGKLNGMATLYFYNGNLKSTGNYTDDLKNGEHRYYDFKGRLTNVENYVNDKLEGMSRTYYSNGNISYETNYKNDKAEGTYKSFFSSGKLYLTGEFKNGERQGLWTTYYEDGTISEKTTYLNNDITGEFTEYHPNGALSIKGTYYKKKIDGKCESYDDDGKIYQDVLYDRGKLKEINFYNKEGKIISTTTTSKGGTNIVFYSPDGIKTAEGYYNKEGYKDGTYTSYYSTGKVNEVSNWKNGIQDGPLQSFYTSGKPREISNYSNDEEDGYSKSFYANGKVSGEGWKVEGDRQQKFLFSNAMGDLTSTEYYLNGELSGFSEQYEPGNHLSSETYYSNGWVKSITQFDSTGKELSVNNLIKGKGPLIYKYPNGKIKSSATYDHYLLNGPYTFYFFDGSVSAIIYYKNDEPDSIYRSYYYGGKPMVEGAYKDGEKTGLWKYYFENGKLEREENYKNNLQEGENKIYLSNGNIDKIIVYKKNKPESNIIYTDKNDVAIKFNYKSGVVVSYQYEEKPGVLCTPVPVKGEGGKIIAKYPNGQVSMTTELINNESEGERKIYYANGKLYTSSFRIAGYPDGNAKVYYSNGNLWEDENYVAGNLHGLCKYYYPNGKIEREENYYDNDKHGVCKYYDEQGKLKKTHIYRYGSLVHAE